MNAQDDIARKIKPYLDRGAAELRPGLVYRLQRARAEALSRLPLREAAADMALSGSRGGTLGIGGRPFWAQPRVWLAIGVLIAGLFGAHQWSEYQRVKELADLDAQILSSDLPIDAYLDRGFQNWLRDPDLR